jgi:hypothetical protein
MIPNHYLDLILGLIAGVTIGFGLAAVISSFRRARAYNMGWNAARDFFQNEKRNRL